MKKASKHLFLFVILLIGCEEVVVIDLPPTQNLIVIEGFLTNQLEHQEISLSTSTAFLSTSPTSFIENAIAFVRSSENERFDFEYVSNGLYRSQVPFKGKVGVEYQLSLFLDGGLRINSDWDRMPFPTIPDTVLIETFVDSDPENNDLETDFFFPSIRVRDSINYPNFYRWKFLKNNVPLVEPSPITLQSDRFFDGNFIPNEFDEFSYREGDTAIVQLQSITEATFLYLRLLASQITTLGTSSGTTPAQVIGNFSSSDESVVLGYFGTAAIASDTLIMRRQ
ncbi:MAG: DUF4249 domain-containing protein [Bacteroidota bacterium]